MFSLSMPLPVSYLLVRLVLAPVQLIQHCPLPPSERPRLGVSCNTRAWLAVPFLCRRAEEVLTPMDFSFVDFAESMFCFCLPRQGPWINISFHHSLSLYVSVCTCVCVIFPLCPYLGNHIPFLPLPHPSHFPFLLFLISAQFLAYQQRLYQ